MAITILSLLSIFALLSLSIDADYVLYNGEVLMAGQNLTNGPYQLAMQTDCDLVLYHKGYPTWRANVDQKGENCYLGLKPTGELVVRRDVHFTLWSSTSKSKKGKYALVLDSNGDLGVYGSRRWTSNNPKEAGKPGGSTVDTEYVLYSGNRLTLGRKLVYRDYVLAFDRCNLVIVDTKSGKILWQTNTKSKGCYLQLESGGELILKHLNEKLWSSNKKADSGKYIAVMRFDGRLAVYGPLVWTNGGDAGGDDSGEPKHAIDQVRMELSTA